MASTDLERAPNTKHGQWHLDVVRRSSYLESYVCNKPDLQCERIDDCLYGIDEHSAPF
jgi:hypothetical protein